MIEIPYQEPIAVAALLANRHRLAFLDSALPQQGFAHPDLCRWSYIAVDPVSVFTILADVAYLDHVAQMGDPLLALRAELADRKYEHIADGPPFQSGAIGTLSYEAAHLFEALPWPRLNTSEPEVEFCFYDVVLAFDEPSRRMFICGPGAANFQMPDTHPVSSSTAQAAHVSEWQDSRTRSAYEAEVAALVDAIRDGHIFQANLSHCFEAECDSQPDALLTYQMLRAANAAPFSALLVNGDKFVASTSPERFFKLQNGDVEMRPIKGTARRHADPEADRKAATALSHSEKDRAENTMIVDLLRNDLSRVAVPETVEVPVLCGVETYRNLHHLVSVVTARLEPERDVIDLLAATFPGGSITGAPKLKAMELIAATERAPRGVYCGAIGWIGDNGDADFNIAIRTLVGKGKTVSVHAGGGITLLSDPADEYEETLLKAETILRALNPTHSPESANQ